MKRIRVGLVGVSPGRGFTMEAHIPALQKLPEFEIVAVCTTRQESAEAAARHFGIPLAFADAAKMAAHPDVDLVTVCVKVPDHCAAVMAAIDAGKNVYCEWPLGRTSEEARRMCDVAQRSGVSHIVGLQGRCLPAVNYARDLIAEGYIGRVRTATMIVNAPSWATAVNRPLNAEMANGANLVTIQGGHNLDILCYCLGEFSQLSAFAECQRAEIQAKSSNATVAKDVPDQVVVNGIVGDGVVVSFQLRGGMTRGEHFLFEIHGERGDLALRATVFDISTQRQELTLHSGRGDRKGLEEMPIPACYHWVPDDIPRDSPYNVAQLYSAVARAIAAKRPVSPDFGVALDRHRLLDAVLESARTGQRWSRGLT